MKQTETLPSTDSSNRSAELVIVNGKRQVLMHGAVDPSNQSSGFAPYNVTFFTHDTPGEIASTASYLTGVQVDPSSVELAYVGTRGDGRKVDYLLATADPDAEAPLALPNSTGPDGEPIPQVWMDLDEAADMADNPVHSRALGAIAVHLSEQ